jgi:hypothetical protein
MSYEPTPPPPPDQPDLLPEAFSPATLARWQKDPGIRAAYAEARRQVLEQTVAQLLGATGEAVAAIKDNLKVKRAADRLAAAVKLIEFAFKGTETLDLADRVNELEALLRGDADEPPQPDRPAVQDGEAGPTAGPEADQGLQGHGP